MRRLACVAVLALLLASCGSSTPEPWPPKIGEAYPDLELKAMDGRSVRLSSFKGKVLLVEPIGMTCPACNMFAGARRTGPYPGAEAAKGPSADELFARYAPGVSAADPNLVYVQLLLFNMEMKPPTAADAAAWARHFQVGKFPNRIVLALADERFHSLGRYQATYDLIPGFQLIDRKFTLRYDASGHNPRHRFWDELFPKIGALLKEPA